MRSRILPAVPLRSLEVAYGLCVGKYDAPWPTARPVVTPRAAFERVVLEAVRRPPCLVSFSGGVDSSALLALATELARQEQVPDPIPATLEFPGSEDADESEWQHIVLDRLNLGQWLRLSYSNEMDAVGPIAQEVLTRHGLIWPFNLHLHLPIIKAAAGGSLITGFGGDELGRSSAGLNGERIVAARRMNQPLDAVHALYAHSPIALKIGRELLRQHKYVRETRYLTRNAKVQLWLAKSREDAQPFGWDRIVRQSIWRRRYFQVCRANFSILSQPYDVRVVHPFVEQTVLASFGRYDRLGALRGRQGIIADTLGDILPRQIVTRTSKGRFTDPLWTETSQRFAESWTGRGLDEDLVDAEMVRETWLGRRPRRIMTTSLLQAAWLADRGVLPAKPAA